MLAQVSGLSHKDKLKGIQNILPRKQKTVHPPEFLISRNETALSVFNRLLRSARTRANNLTTVFELIDCLMLLQPAVCSFKILLNDASSCSALWDTGHKFKCYRSAALRRAMEERENISWIIISGEKTTKNGAETLQDELTNTNYFKRLFNGGLDFFIQRLLLPWIPE